MAKAAVMIYHNPRCSKSRQTLKILQEQGIEPEVILYLDRPPSKTRLAELIKQAGLEPIDVVRVKEKTAKELGIGKKDFRDAELITLMVENPILIERPIVVKGRKAVLARPPERVEEIL